MRFAIDELGCQKVKAIVKLYAETLKVPQELHIEYVCNACCSNLDLAPGINRGRGNNLRSHECCVQQWVSKFKHGYETRISVRTSNMPGTVPDPAIIKILMAGLQYTDQSSVSSIIDGHRIAMSAENILGLLLEEFLFTKLSAHGWAMAWGETIRSVDFCNADGVLLQIKNRSNSENSSSSKIRTGTPIKKWFRVNATNGRYKWEYLRDIIGWPAAAGELDEQPFQSFIQEVLTKNPKALAIEPESPYRPEIRN